MKVETRRFLAIGFLVWLPTRLAAATAPENQIHVKILEPVALDAVNDLYGSLIFGFDLTEFHNRMAPLLIYLETIDSFPDEVRTNDPVIVQLRERVEQSILPHLHPKVVPLPFETLAFFNDLRIQRYLPESQREEFAAAYKERVRKPRRLQLANMIDEAVIAWKSDNKLGTVPIIDVQPDKARRIMSSMGRLLEEHDGWALSELRLKSANPNHRLLATEETLMESGLLNPDGSLDDDVRRLALLRIQVTGDGVMIVWDN